jgi:hypothetical protein
VRLVIAWLAIRGAMEVGFEVADWVRMVRRWRASFHFADGGES